MDTKFSAEDQSFQNEVRAFLKEHITDDLLGLINNIDTYKAGIFKWQTLLYEKGWIAPRWPQKYGGTNWTVTQRHIFHMESALAGAPHLFPFGLLLVGPIIYTYGTDEQKARFLPRILCSKDWWCQGYSEPGAGSDLASLKTTATLDGDEYVVNGSKIWTSFAHYADWMFCLTRSDSSGRKQEGITFLLIDMKTPGITIKPIISISGEHRFNQVYLDNVRVPAANRIGEEGKGWTYAKALLVHERTATAAVAESQIELAKIKKEAKQEINGGRNLFNNPFFQKRLSDLEIELMAQEYTLLRVLSNEAKGKEPGAESSILKLEGATILKSMQELRMDITAYYAGSVQGDLTATQLGHDSADSIRRNYLQGRAISIFGGTDEIQKNIIARYVLKLPQ